MPGIDGSICATGRSRAALGGVLGIRAINGHPTVSSAVPFASLSSRLPGSGDGFSPCLQTVSDDSRGLVLTAGCHRLTTPCQGLTGSAEGSATDGPTALYAADAPGALPFCDE